jgi:mRNA-degrading endonuclease RelE of RelBE toxin-antitoxin system
MTRQRRTIYRIEYAPEVEGHLDVLTKREASTVLDAVPRYLGNQPTLATRNRKPLQANPIAPWELRIGDLRVYFEVLEEGERLVRIVAVGRKERERVLIGGVEVKLR